MIAAPPPPAATTVMAASRGADALVQAQTHLAQIHWTTPTSTPSDPLVAVLDTGVDGSTVGLQASLAPNARSFAPDSPDPLRDSEGHGTHVAGIIAARPGAGEGVAGVASARLLIVKIADASGRTGTSALVKGINYAIARRARIINISLGGGGYSRLEQAAVDRAVRAGALVVTAAGNSGSALREYPGSYRQVLTVGAVDGQGRPLASSTTGPQVAVAAPGEGILSTLPGGRFGQLSGTSMAAAIVSGVAARVWAARPALTASQVAGVIEESARDVGTPGRDDATGSGLVDLAAALAARPPATDPGEPNDTPPDAQRSRPLMTLAGPDDATVSARLGSWRDPRDGYRVPLDVGQTLTVDLTGPPGIADFDLRLWRPGTPAPRNGAAFSRTWLAAGSFGPTATERLRFTAQRRGTYVVEVEVVRGSGRYRLHAQRAVT